ncbi:hypothetical protein ACFLQY_01170 [Verrucomicrobiota bacterium]
MNNEAFKEAIKEVQKQLTDYAGKDSLKKASQAVTELWRLCEDNEYIEGKLGEFDDVFMQTLECKNVRKERDLRQALVKICHQMDNALSWDK